MMKLAAIIVIACLATSAAGLWFRPKKELNFDALNKYLVKEEPNDDDHWFNVALLKNNVGQLKGSLKRTAELVIKLAASDQCNYDKLAILVQINAASINLTGKKRIEKVLEPYVAKVDDICIKFIEETIDELRNSMDYNDVEFTENFWRKTVWDNGHFARNSNLSLLYNGSELLEFLKVVGWDDPEADLLALDEITGKPAVPKKKATYAFNKYIGKPCKHISLQFKELFAGFRAIRVE